MAGSEALPEGRAIPARIVIADDHGLVRQGFRGMLAREEGLEVVGEAEDGREAVEHLRQREQAQLSIRILELYGPPPQGKDLG
jgi:DNA-binding NarL/FixJ family response regulator